MSADGRNVAATGRSAVELSTMRNGNLSGRGTDDQWQAANQHQTGQTSPSASLPRSAVNSPPQFGHHASASAAPRANSDPGPAQGGGGLLLVEGASSR